MLSLNDFIDDDPWVEEGPFLQEIRIDNQIEGVRLNRFIDAGESNKVLLTIPPGVVHGVHNRGLAAATFINMPTRAYDPANPDKSRLPYNHPGIPYRFD